MPDTLFPQTSPLLPGMTGEAAASLAMLLGRASVPPRLLRGPGPDEAQLQLAVAAALRAPDHGGLRPWRFVFIEGLQRGAFGDLLAASLARREPATPPERLELERAKPLRAPLLIAVGAALNHDRPGVPVWEQEATVAAGAMNFLNALEALGFGAIWLSSQALRDPVVKLALGFAEKDALLGWIYVGTPAADRPTSVRPDPAGFHRRWGV